VWTRDTERGLRLGRQIQSGALFVNAVVSSDPGCPLVARSAADMAGEPGVYGIRAFGNVRTVWVGPADGFSAPTSLAE